jgi:hypothetical protein
MGDKSKRTNLKADIFFRTGHVQGKLVPVTERIITQPRDQPLTHPPPLQPAVPSHTSHSYSLFGRSDLRVHRSHLATMCRRSLALPTSAGRRCYRIQKTLNDKWTNDCERSANRCPATLEIFYKHVGASARIAATETGRILN